MFFQCYLRNNNNNSKLHIRKIFLLPYDIMLIEIFQFNFFEIFRFEIYPTKFIYCVYERKKSTIGAEIIILGIFGIGTV